MRFQGRHNMITIEQVFQSAIKKLQNKTISPHLDAEILLAFILKKPKEYLYINPKIPIDTKMLKKINLSIRRRMKHEPIAYITGHKEFYGLDFLVEQSVLIPRPETELMVEEVLKILKTDPLSPPLPEEKKLIVDVGTGSGCIPIAIVKNTDVRAIAIDNSDKALKIARINAKRHGVFNKIKFIKSNLLKSYKLKAINYKLLIITANLPYLPTSEWRRAPLDVKKYEPRSALDGGHDGLKYYLELLQQIEVIARITQIPIFCLFEFCPEQKNTLKNLILTTFPTAKMQIKKDLAKQDRLLILEIGN